MGEVYVVGKMEGHYKIGRSTDAENRLLSFSPKLPIQLAILHRVTTHDEVWLERVLHAAFHHRRALGEWFKLEDSELELIQTMRHVVAEGDLPGAILDAFLSRNPPPLPPSPVARVASFATDHSTTVPTPPGVSATDFFVRVRGAIGTGPTVQEKSYGEGGNRRTPFAGDVAAYVVRGDSMRDEAILNGDIIIVRETPSPTAGERVVAWVEAFEGCVLKRYKGRGVKRWLESPDGWRHDLTAEDSVFGVLVGVVRTQTP